MFRCVCVRVCVSGEERCCLFFVQKVSQQVSDFANQQLFFLQGKGEADLATRMFLKRTREALMIPVLGLFDSDAHGLKILSVYVL